MEKTRNYKNEIYIVAGLWFLFIISEIRGLNIFPDGELPFPFLGFVIGAILGMILRKERLKYSEIIILPILIWINYILSISGIYIPNKLLLYIGLIGLIIFYVYQSASRWKLYKIGAITLLSLSILALDYHLYNIRIIKDRSFQRYIKSEFDIRGSITPENLESIDRIFLSGQNKVTSLEGIQHFKNLEDIYIADTSTIKDLSPLNDVTQLKQLVLWSMDLNRLAELGELNSLEQLELVYPEKGEIGSLKDYQALRVLRIQGLDFDNLKGLNGPKNLEELSIGDAKVKSFDGVDGFSNLKELRLYKLYVEDIRDIFILEDLEKIDITGGIISTPDNFEEILLDKGIQLEKSKSIEELLEEIVEEEL